MTEVKKYIKENIFIIIIIVVFFIMQLGIWLSQLSAIGWLILIITLFGFIITALKIYQIIEQRKTDDRLIELKKQGSLEQLRQMEPIDFEIYVRDLFRQFGYKAEVTPPTGDGGKDILIYKDDTFAVVECKRYNMSTKVSRPDIQKFHSAIIDCQAEKGYFVTTGEFTIHAINYAKDKPIELINGEKLVDLIMDITPNRYQSL